MSKRELIDRESDRLPEQDLDRLLAFVQSLKEAHADANDADVGCRICIG